jgi:hypothetical protein
VGLVTGMIALRPEKAPSAAGSRTPRSTFVGHSPIAGLVQVRLNPFPMRRSLPFVLLLLGAFALSAPSCNKKSSDTVIVYEDEQPTASTRTVDGTVRAARMGGNMQGAFYKKSRVQGKPFYKYGKVEELSINLSRGISGTGATLSRYGDPAKDQAYVGHGWARSARDYPHIEKAQSQAKRETRETVNYYTEWLDFCRTTGMSDIIITANYFMPFNELDALIKDAQAQGLNILWIEADNEMNSPEHIKMLQAELQQKDSRASSYRGIQRVEKAFELYWDWVEELEAFCDPRGLKVSYVGTPPAYAFPDMLDPETMGSKANLSQKKAQSDRMFNDMGSQRVRSGRLKGEAVSRHRYRQWDIVGREMQQRNDDLRRRLEYPIYRNYYEDLKETEADHWRSLYPDAQILMTEWALRKSVAGAGHSMAAAIDVVKHLMALAQINAAYGETVFDAATYQTLFAPKMGGLLFPESNGVGIAPEGWAYHLCSVMDGAPVLEVGNGDNTHQQWIRVSGNRWRIPGLLQPAQQRVVHPIQRRVQIPGERRPSRRTRQHQKRTSQRQPASARCWHRAVALSLIGERCMGFAPKKLLVDLFKSTP